MAFEGLKKIFGRKKELPPIPKEILEQPKTVTAESSDAGNLRAKMDLLLTQLESLNVRYDTLNQRLANMERMVQEIYVIAKR